jgi:hypothetical protein
MRRVRAGELKASPTASHVEFVMDEATRASSRENVDPEAERGLGAHDVQFPREKSGLAGTRRASND